MPKETAILVVSVSTLIIAGWAAFSVYDLDNSTGQFAEAEDYTSEFSSIKTGLDKVAAKLEALEADTMIELQKIKADLEQVKQSTTESIIETQLEITSDKDSYVLGEEILVSATGLVPQKAAIVELISSTNEVISKQTIFSDIAGKLQTDFNIPEFLSIGSYKLKATYDDIVDETFIIISDKTQSTNNNGLTINLEREIYSPGEIIRVNGLGSSNTPIASQMISPVSQVTTTNSGTASDGSYTFVYILDPDAPVGDWKIKVNQGSYEAEAIFQVES